MPDQIVDNLKTVLDAGKDIGRADKLGQAYEIEPGGIPFLMRANGEPLNAEPYLAAPVFKRAAVDLHDADSFVGYVNRFKDGGSLIFANLPARKFEAVLDFHG